MHKENENEINDLLEGFMPEPTEPEEPSIETPTEPPSSDVPPDEEVPPVGSEPPPPDSEPQVGTPVKEQPTVEPVVEPPVADPKDAQIAQMQETIAALQKTIESVSKQVSQGTSAQPEVPDAREAIKFVEKEEDLDKALNTVDNFNGLLTSVAAKIEEILTAKVDALASRAAHNVYTQRSAANEFYTQNADLAQNKAFVALVANDLAAAHPDWDMSKIIENLGTEVRSRLKLGTPTPTAGVFNDTTQKETPAFAGPTNGGRKTGPPKPTDPIEREVMDLLDGM